MTGPHTYTHTVERGEPDLIFLGWDDGHISLKIVKDGECQVFTLTGAQIFRLATDGLSSVARHVKFER